MLAMPLLNRRSFFLDSRSHTDPSLPTSPVHDEDVGKQHHLSPASANVTPKRPVSENGLPHSRLSNELRPSDVPEPTQPEGDHKPSKPFSLMRFRNLSESHLQARAKLDAQAPQASDMEELPPVPTVTADGVVPQIVKTAPTMDHLTSQKLEAPHEEVQRNVRPSLFKRASSKGRKSAMKEGRKSLDMRRSDKKSSLRWTSRGRTSGLDDLHRLSTMHINNNHSNPQSAPPSYDESSSSALAVPLVQPPIPRFSESSRSDASNASSGDGHIYGSTTTTISTTHTTFFKLPRRNKNRNSLFPLPLKIPPPDEPLSTNEHRPKTPRAYSAQPDTLDIAGLPVAAQAPETGLQRRHTELASPVKRRPHSLSAPNAALAKASLSFAEPGLKLFRESSQNSQSPRTASPFHPPMRPGMRNRSSTHSSFVSTSRETDTPPPLSASGRNSFSTTGRSSLGGFLSLSRFRQGSEPHSPRHGSPGTMSKTNSFAISREALVIPEREEGDTPGKYLERLESAVARSVIAGILSKSSDPFAAAVLRSYTRRFSFFGEPIDMSLRKFLLEAELPKETQQVDRVVQAFADRYHECNPGIFLNSDQAYVIAFSIMMLHTDAFNKNNKRKMQKQDYIKNTAGQGLSDEILACFYDNICYTPFVHYEEDVDINGERVLSFNPKQKKSNAKLKSAIPGSSDALRKPAGPVDPYNLLVEQKLDTLRPSLKDTIIMDDPYDYRGNMGELDVTYLQRAFTHTGVLQIISARSRPAAYESQILTGNPNPAETQQGIVDLKITKVGTLWRKSSKKKKTRSPWQEWGAILTGSQLYLFKNSHWAKGLMHQFNHQQKSGWARTPVVFKPPLQDFKPDALIKTDNAVALIDLTYTRHKNAFVFVRPGGQEEVLLADSEAELTDWLGLINYAAAFRAAGVRIRGMLGGAEEDVRNRDIRRLDSTNSVRSVHTHNGETVLQNRGFSSQLHQQVMAARRQVMVHKIAALEKEITDANRQLESMLRNGRHVLVLAPIAPRTREDVIHAAAHVDAMIKWLRRDIWRLKCHRDILAMDVRLDGMTASELEKYQNVHSKPQHLDPELVRTEKPKILSRLSSTKPSAAKSPPQSPPSTLARPSTRGSIETVANTDVFRTPPEFAISVKDDGWQLPPLKLETNDLEQHHHRASVTGSLHVPASPRHGSLTHSSSASSILQVARTNSIAASENTLAHAKVTPTPSIDGRESQLSTRQTISPAQVESAARALSREAQSMGASPSTAKQKGVRKGLHKTLRDAGHHRHSTHKHRRNKDSDSTVRSTGVDDRDAKEDTPGLQRDKPRFILHGKQASVVQFGGDWERMKFRREQYESQHTASPAHASREAAYAEYARQQVEQQHELLRAGQSSPAVQELYHSDVIDEDDDEPEDMLSVRSFREDAKAAAAYASVDDLLSADEPRSLVQLQPAFSMGETYAGQAKNFESSPWDAGAGQPASRQTISGRNSLLPESLRFSNDNGPTQRESLSKGDDSNVNIIVAGDEETPRISSSLKGKGRQRIDPPRGTPGQVSRLLAESSASSNRASTYSDYSVEGEHGFVQPISDEELLRMSSTLDGMSRTEG